MKVNETKKSAGATGKDISSQDEEENAKKQITKTKYFNFQEKCCPGIRLTKICTI